MELALPLLMALLVGVVLGALVGFLLGRRGQTPGAGAEDPRFAEMRHQNEIAAVRAEEAAIRNQLDREHLARAGAESARASDAHARLQAQVTGLSARLEGMSDEILRHEERYRDLVDRHRTDAELQKQRDAAESRVLQVLTPVQETLRTMQAKVAEIESQRSLQHGEITQQLRAAADSEERLRSTAESLASALRSNSTRGVWGETQLRSVVEAAGLMQRVDFSTQSSITTDSGAGRPDMVVHLPGGKNIAVDAKVPFNSYLEAAAIPSTASEAELARKATLMRAHVKAVRDHISALGSKTYWEGLDSSPEMVIAFIPSESLVSSALEADPSIMEFAFSKRVALSSPVTLWSVLKTVAFSWQQDVVTAEARSLFDLSKELYGRLATMAGHVSKLGRSLETSVKSYNSFVGSLERQVLPSARRLNALDESKVLSPLEGIEEAPRELTAYEMTTRADGAAVDVLAELDAIAPHQPELIDFTAPATPRAEHPKTA